jgi:polysaccharide export outer membrane protein
MILTTSFDRVRSFSFALFLAGLAGCSNTPPPEVGRIQPQIGTGLGQEAFAGVEADASKLKPMVLRPADVVSVTVFREPDLSLDNILVSEDGTIALPLVGTLDAAGHTLESLSNEIARRLIGAHLLNPQVTVGVRQYASRRVTVEGGVTQSGVYPFSPGARLSDALALAQGPSRVAKLNQVAIFRHDAQGLAVAVFDYRAVQQGKMIDPQLQPGDRVVVGLSGLSQAWQDLIKALPAFAIFTRF